MSSSTPSTGPVSDSSTPVKHSRSPSGVKRMNKADENVELKSMPSGGEDAATKQLPLEEDIMQLARLGEIVAIQKLFDSGKYNAKYRDEEGITPLHWAAINNQYALCKFLIDSGADVNAKGGESVATPAMWAAQRCHYYIVHLLLGNGADPLLVDVQGYNILHLATIDGNAFLLVLLLHQEIPVDVTDPQGHTSLMWAAYKGFPACVDLFLRWGANVNAVDEGGLTPLHWALVKGSQPCIQKIIEYGADRFVPTRDGKTPATVASEMRTTRMWYRALHDCGYDVEGNPRTLPLGLTKFARSKSVTGKFFFFWPFLLVFCAIWLLSNMVIYAAVPFTLVAVFFMQWIAMRVADWGPPEYRVIQRTPFMAGVFAGTLFWVGLRWLTHVLPTTYSTNPFLNLLFALFYGLTTYFYFISMTEDPGHVPKLGSRNQQRNVISELFQSWQFDEAHFCVVCMARKPLRSKHCRRCGRCVAKHDHHCPWIDNCVAANNFRHFILYIFCLEIGIVGFVQLVIAYIQLLPAPADSQCNVLSSSICNILLRDPFTIVLAIWSTLNLIWSTMLCVVQLIQISRNQTTYENMKGHSIDHGHLPSHAVPSTAGQGMAMGATGGSGTTIAAVPARHRDRTGCFGQCKRLLGLDTFVATAQDGFGDRHRSARPRNPFSRGIITNCRDFWCDPAPVFGKRESGSAYLDGETVNYNRMYDMPLRLRSGGRSGGMAYTSLAGEDAENTV